MDIDGPTSLAACLDGENLGSFRSILDVRYRATRSKQARSVGTVDLVLAKDAGTQPAARCIHLRLHDVTEFALKRPFVGYPLLEYVRDRGWEGVGWELSDGEQGESIHCLARAVEVHWIALPSEL